jgi:hypothetical protein
MHKLRKTGNYFLPDWLPASIKIITLSITRLFRKYRKKEKNIAG